MWYVGNFFNLVSPEGGYSVRTTCIKLLKIPCMKRVKQLTFKSWTIFREWYLRMKETFTELSVSFLKVMNKKS